MENLPRVLPGNLKAQIDAGLWSIPPVFGWLAHNVRIMQALQISILFSYVLHKVPEATCTFHFIKRKQGVFHFEKVKEKIIFNSVICNFRETSRPPR